MQSVYPELNSPNMSVFLYLAARLLSDIANPLFIPPVVLLLLGWIDPVSAEEFGWMTGLAVFFYSIIPLGVTLYLLHQGFIQSLDLPEQKNRDRLFIYFILSSSAGSLLLFFYFCSIHPFLAMTALVFLLNPVIGYIINLKWKISIHTAALATAGTIFLLLFILSVGIYKAPAGILSLSILLLLLPLMMWARYHLRLHTVPELMCGAFAGIIFTLIEISIMLRIW